ncbi:hypothetical protein [Deinococcus rubellus]|uniref:hypothetical protein n=1 Tax=Deinococcus rubellus TaxID=1889240 RepID=UPI0031EB5CD9
MPAILCPGILEFIIFTPDVFMLPILVVCIFTPDILVLDIFVLDMVLVVLVVMGILLSIFWARAGAASMRADNIIKERTGFIRLLDSLR